MPSLPKQKKVVNSISDSLKKFSSEGESTPMPFLELEQEYPELLPIVVERIARLGETVNIIAPSKAGKSWMMYDLALSIANGKKWLGKFQATAGKVLIIDNELHPNTIVFRIRKVADARNLSPQNIDVYCIRGKEMDYTTLKNGLEEMIEGGEYVAVIIDSHYRMIPDGTDEISNGQMKVIYNMVDRMAGLTCSTWFLVHHQSKGDQSQKSVTEVGSGAGTQSRAADTHLVFREHQKDKHFIVDAAVRSFPPFEPIVIIFDSPLWKTVDDANPLKLGNSRTRMLNQNDNGDKSRIIDLLEEDSPLSVNQIRSKIAIDKGRCQRLLEDLVENEVVGKRKSVVSGNSTTVYYLVE